MKYNLKNVPTPFQREVQEWFEGFEKMTKRLFPTDQRFHEIYDMAFELMADHEQARKQVLKFINDMWKAKKEILG